MVLIGLLTGIQNQSSGFGTLLQEKGGEFISEHAQAITLITLVASLAFLLDYFTKHLLIRRLISGILSLPKLFANRVYTVTKRIPYSEKLETAVMRLFSERGGGELTIKEIKTALEMKYDDAGDITYDKLRDFVKKSKYLEEVE